MHAQAQPSEISPQPSTVDAADVARFSAIAAEWWDPNGKFKPLHQLNPARIRYIRDTIAAHFTLPSLPLTTHHSPLTLLDVGCGGGLIAEPMARLGMQVTAIDASEKNIAVATLHADQSGLNIDYRATTAEDLASNERAFDVVLALEIVEHVADIELFLRSIAQLVKPGGLVIMSTLNRTTKSYLMAIVGAEYVLRWLPRGTHSWKQFLKPSELSRALTHTGLEVRDITGLVLNPIRWEWELNPRDLDVNYLISAKKP